MQQLYKLFYEFTFLLLDHYHLDLSGPRLLVRGYINYERLGNPHFAILPNLSQNITHRMFNEFYPWSKMTTTVKTCPAKVHLWFFTLNTTVGVLHHPWWGPLIGPNVSVSKAGKRISPRLDDFFWNYQKSRCPCCMPLESLHFVFCGLRYKHRKNCECCPVSQLIGR